MKDMKIKINKLEFEYIDVTNKTSEYQEFLVGCTNVSYQILIKSDCKTMIEGYIKLPGEYTRLMAIDYLNKLLINN